MSPSWVILPVNGWETSTILGLSPWCKNKGSTMDESYEGVTVLAIRTEGVAVVVVEEAIEEKY